MTKQLKQHGLFSSRETLDEALTYSDRLIKSLPGEHQMAAYTAMWVPLNTAIAQLEKASLSNLQLKPRTHTSLVIADLTPEQASQHVRNCIVPAIGMSKDLEEVSPRQGRALTILLILVAKMYNLGENEIIDEMAQHLSEEIKKQAGL